MFSFCLCPYDDIFSFISRNIETLMFFLSFFLFIVQISIDVDSRILIPGWNVRVYTF